MLLREIDVKSDHHSDRRIRRGVFRFWIGLTIVFALVLALVLPIIQGERFAFLAGVPVIALNLVLLFVALGWLIWYVWAPSLRRRRSGSDHESTSHPRR